MAMTITPERIAELQSQCRDAFDLPALKLSELDALLSLAARAASGESEWRKMDSAPRDRKVHILAYPVFLDRAGVVAWEPPASTPPTMRFVSAERHDHDGFWRVAYTAQPTPYQPTHWRPLPEPPKDENDG